MFRISSFEFGVYCSPFLINYLPFPVIFFTPFSFGEVFFLTRDPVVFGRPFPEVDQPAPLGAKGPERIVVPGGLLFTDRANYFSDLLFFRHLSSGL